MSESLEPVELVIADVESGQRLDKVLAARDLPWSRSILQRWIEEGRVALNGVPESSPRKKVHARDVVRIEPLPPPTSDALPQELPLDIVFEDEHLLVVNKPAGLVVHPAPGHPDGTLVNAILHHTVVEQGEDPTRPGIVHRLDKDTSGVMVVAKTGAAKADLVTQFQAHSIERAYQAIAVGAPPEQVTFETLIGRHPTDRKRFSSKVTRGKRAVTHVSVQARLHGATWVECRLETGRTHQIRVHMSDHGFPLLGDPLYGRPPKDAKLKSAAHILSRQALHAGLLGFVHPMTRVPLRFTSALPEDFEQAVAALRPD